MKAMTKQMVNLIREQSKDPPRLWRMLKKIYDNAILQKELSKEISF